MSYNELTSAEEPAGGSKPAAIGGDDDVLLDIDAMCKFWGGENAPLHPATIYRAIKAGRIPRPFKPSPGVVRWSRREQVEARARMLAERGGSAPSTG